MIHGMRDYQTDCVDKTINSLSTDLSCAPLIVLPTGAGKTWVIAGLIDAVLQDDPQANVLIISHVKEILDQNRKSIEEVLRKSVSTYSAGLGTKQIGKITVAGIQSIYKNPDPFRDFDLIIIDEAHLIPPRGEGMYQTFLKEMIHSRTVGLTATPFRLGSGHIYGPERLFTHCSVDYSNFDNFNALINGGYLCKLSSKATALQLRTEGVKVTGGDFNEKALALANDKDEVTNAAIKEIMELGEGRKKILIFAIDIKHAESIVEKLREVGATAECVHSKMEKDRDGIIRRFKDGDFRCLVNVNVLTTGFDAPDIDLVALLRPTQSPVLHVQTIGRGLRIHPEKSDCLILDFAGNISRLGCINDIIVEKKKRAKKDEKGEPRAKVCPECMGLNPLRATVCGECGYTFPERVKITREADWVSPIRTGRTNKKWFFVKEVKYERYWKPGSPAMVKATYDLGGQAAHKFICVEHRGPAKYYADEFVEKMGLDPCDTVDALIEAARAAERLPYKLLIDTEGKYPEILEVINKALAPQTDCDTMSAQSVATH